MSFTLYIIILCFYIFYLVFTRCGSYEEALSSFQKSGNWRQVFCMASLLRHTDEHVISLARSVAGMNSLCVPFHENAKPVIFLMITFRVIETQSISKLYRHLKKRFVKKFILRSLFVQKRSWCYRPIRLTQCCTQFKSPGDKILCVLYLHYNVAFTFK